MKRSSWTRSPWRSAISRASLALVLASSALSAQSPVTPMTASEPHEALSYFEGSWTIEEQDRAQGLIEACAWLPSGRRHLVCRSTWRVATGPREAWSIYSYRAADSTYVYYGLRSGGAIETLEGRRSATGWEFFNQRGSGATRVRLRVTLTPLTQDRFRFTAETAVGDGPWTDPRSEHYVRVVPRP